MSESHPSINDVPIEAIKHQMAYIELFHKLSDIPRMENENDAWAALDDIEYMAQQLGAYTKAFSRLWRCVHAEIWRRWMYPLPITKESNYYPLFADALPLLIPGASLTTVPIHKYHKPDFFIKISGNIVPVEIKSSVIRMKDVDQLQRYMKVYKASCGYLIGPELRGRLKKGMQFCKWNPFNIRTTSSQYENKGI